MNVEDLPKTKKYHHGALRAACLRHGLEVLREVGAVPFSLREVARRAGVSATAIYHHFPDKEDLLAALTTIGLDDFRSRLTAAIGTSPSPSEALIQMGRVYLEFFRDHPYFLDLLFATHFAQYPEVIEARNGTFGLLMDVLMKMGVKAQEADAFALWVWSAIHGLSTLIKAEVLTKPPVDCPYEFVQVFKLGFEELEDLILPLFSRIVSQGALSVPEDGPRG